MAVAKHLTSPHLTSPHLTAPHHTSPHLTSPHGVLLGASPEIGYFMSTFKLGKVSLAGILHTYDGVHLSTNTLLIIIILLLL
jgi:hypothetical protein